MCVGLALSCVHMVANKYHKGQCVQLYWTDVQYKHRKIVRCLNWNKFNLGVYIYTPYHIYVCDVCTDRTYIYVISTRFVMMLLNGDLWIHYTYMEWKWTKITLHIIWLLSVLGKRGFHFRRKSVTQFTGMVFDKNMGLVVAYKMICWLIDCSIENII